MEIMANAVLVLTAFITGLGVMALILVPPYQPGENTEPYRPFE